ncbi:M13 family metallopeptidase [bacterium]|nr:M13 family metallopeptidase [bacterium]
MKKLALAPLATLIIILGAFAGCTKTQIKPTPGPQFNPPTGRTRTPEVKMLDVAALDAKVKPCDDFYQYACGGWIENTQMPKDKVRIARSFISLRDRNTEILNDYLENYSKGKLEPASPLAKQLGDFYASCMDEAALEAPSPALLKAELDAVDAVQNSKDLAKLVAQLHMKRIQTFFSPSVEQDAKDAATNIVTLAPGGMGLPEKSYYFDDKNKKPEMRAFYKSHLANSFRLAGFSQPEIETQRDLIYHLEESLAEKSLYAAEMRDPLKIYHPMNLQELQKLSPKFDWATYFSTLGVTATKKMNVSQPEYFKQLSELVSLHALPELKNYVKWQIVRQVSAYLQKSLRDEHFDFYNRKMLGQEEYTPLWQRCTGAVDAAMGDALGEVYAAQTFGADGKDKTSKMIQGIRDAFGTNLPKVSWLDDATRKKAEEKLSTFLPKIGYPEKPEKYVGLQISRDSYYKNIMAGNIHSSKETLADLNKPVDRLKWGMRAHTVNAYYNPSLNEIVFPAGILQSPFFSKNGSTAANFGAIGAVMGHELIHGFDDEGRMFDSTGNLKEWWTPAITKSFETKAACIVDQYSKYTVTADKVALNGKLTLGENIADLGGVKFAYLAYQAAKAKGAGGPSLASVITPGPSFSDDQQFFISYAQVWCSKVRDEEQKRLATVDPHSPGQYRVNGVLVNTPEFAKAFNCQAGDKMAPVDRCSLW